MSRIPVVDENDKIISYKDRHYRFGPNQLYRVSALWLTDRQGRILLSQRALNKSHDPGKWGPAVAGTVAEGETYEQNIIKEIEEELGLKDLNLRTGKKVLKKGRYSYFCQWFLATVDFSDLEVNLDPGEVAAVRWFTPEELNQELKENPDKFLTSIQNWSEIFA